jgi:hypothetical protein
MSLNVHPQTGVDVCQADYAAVAKAVGINPATNTTVPCNYANSTVADVMFRVLMNGDPTLAGIDWWWTVGALCLP